MKGFFKDAIYLFCCQGHLKHCLENSQFCRKPENDVGCEGGGEGAEGGLCYWRHYDALRTKRGH